MKKYYNLIFTVAFLVVIITAGYLILTVGAGQQKKTAQNLTNQNTNNQKTEGSNVQKVTVTLTDSGFNPEVLTVKKGTTVIWTNQSGADGSVNSDDHPTNLLFPMLNLGKFSNGSSMTVSFDKPGKYTYHNEFNLNQKGTIVVQ